MNNNVYRYVYFDTTLDTTFRYHFWYRAYHVPLQYPVGTTPFTTSVDRLTFFGLHGMYNPVSDNSSGNITPAPPPGHFYILVVLSCVVELWNDSSCQFTINFLYSIVWKTPHPPTLYHG